MNSAPPRKLTDEERRILNSGAVNSYAYRDLRDSLRADGLKFCAYCQEAQSVGEFYRDKRTASGLSAYCKAHSKGYTARKRSPTVYAIIDRLAAEMASGPEPDPSDILRVPDFGSDSDR